MQFYKFVSQSTKLVCTEHGRFNRTGVSCMQDPWSPASVNLQDELHLSGPSSSNSDMDASSQTPVSEGAFSKSFSRVSYESFEHSFARRAAAGNSPSREEVLASPLASSADDFNCKERTNSSPGSPYLGPTCDDFKESTKDSAEGSVKAMLKMCRTGSSGFRKKSTQQHEMWAPTLASYFRCLEAATLIRYILSHMHRNPCMMKTININATKFAQLACASCASCN